MNAEATQPSSRTGGGGTTVLAIDSIAVASLELEVVGYLQSAKFYVAATNTPSPSPLLLLIESRLLYTTGTWYHVPGT